MRRTYIYISIFIVAILTITGCSSDKSKKGYCYEKGYLSAHIYDPVKNPCKVNFRYKNLSKGVQTPTIDIISYNDAEELIKHDTLNFAQMGPGAAQQLAEVIECQGENISKIYIRDARNSSRCTGYKCSDLCGIKGFTINVSK
ncbi:MAG: hypothetical protein JRC99_00910 [Deltaproteobacteria bacterium]|nr:hypothetical protein [Deltaproteobacteria bacterium]